MLVPTFVENLTSPTRVLPLSISNHPISRDRNDLMRLKFPEPMLPDSSSKMTISTGHFGGTAVMEKLNHTTEMSTWKELRSKQTLSSTEQQFVILAHSPLLLSENNTYKDSSRQRPEKCFSCTNNSVICDKCIQCFVTVG